MVLMLLLLRAACADAFASVMIADADWARDYTMKHYQITVLKIKNSNSNNNSNNNGTNHNSSNYNNSNNKIKNSRLAIMETTL